MLIITVMLCSCGEKVSGWARGEDLGNGVVAVLSDIESKKSKVDKDTEEFMEMSKSKRTFVRIVSAILLILVFCGVIWGVDYGMEWIKGFFY